MGKVEGREEDPGNRFDATECNSHTGWEELLRRRALQTTYLLKGLITMTLQGVNSLFDLSTASSQVIIYYSLITHTYLQLLRFFPPSTSYHTIELLYGRTVGQRDPPFTTVLN